MPSPPAPRRPAPAWRLAVGASLVLGLVPLASGVHFVRAWLTTRAGLSEAEQRETFELAWCDPVLGAMAARLEASLPPDVPLLVTPVGGTDRSGRTRQFLFLADRLYPRPVLVRQPRWASGTLVDYAGWIDYHLELLDTDGSGLSPEGERRRRAKLDRLEPELARYGVEWELEVDLDPERPFARSRLLHRGAPVESGPWVELAP